MKLKVYLASKAVSLCIIGMVGLYLFFVCSFCGLPPSLTIFLILGGFAIAFAGILLGWRRVDLRLRKLKKQLDTLPERYLIGEVLERPKDAVEEEYYLLMKEISHSAIGAVEQARTEKQEYYDYVEQWVHEIKTPLTACSLILSNDKDPSKLRRELRKADNLIESILTCAKLRTAEKEIQIRPAILRDLCDQAIREEMELLIAAGITISIEGNGQVYTDSKLLIFILKQLLINCAKYAQSCHIRIDLQSGVLCFEDNGPGIPSHELRRVTERGFTGSAGRSMGQSTGMGLYIVSQLCQKLNIELEITSQEGVFTRFCFRFGILQNC